MLQKRLIAVINHSNNQKTDNKHCVAPLLFFNVLSAHLISCHSSEYEAQSFDFVRPFFPSFFCFNHHLLLSHSSVMYSLCLASALCLWLKAKTKPLAGNSREKCESVLQIDMPTALLTTQPSLITSQPNRDTSCLLTWVCVCLCVCVCVFECIFAALFAGGHFSSEWDFVSRAHWLATSLGTATHLRVLQTERERYCEWWSRLWSDSPVLSSASSHYTANTHTHTHTHGLCGIACPLDQTRFLFSQLGAGQFALHSIVWLLVLPRFILFFNICLAVKQFWHDIRRGQSLARLDFIVFQLEK